MTPEQLRHYDQQVAKQIEFLIKNNLEVHIPRKGAPYFAKSSKPLVERRGRR